MWNTPWKSQRFRKIPTEDGSSKYSKHSKIECMTKHLGSRVVCVCEIKKYMIINTYNTHKYVYIRNINKISKNILYVYTLYEPHIYLCASTSPPALSWTLVVLVLHWTDLIATERVQSPWFHPPRSAAVRHSYGPGRWRKYWAIQKWKVSFPTVQVRMLC